MSTVYLYVKQHRLTGLKYFGKTTKDPHKYDGSGLLWTRHINKHGREYVDTLDVWAFDALDECTAFAMHYSETNNIVESNDWANMKYENGLDGWVKGTKQKPESISKRVRTRKLKGYVTSNATKKKISESVKSTISSMSSTEKAQKYGHRKGSKTYHTAETRQKIKDAISKHDRCGANNSAYGMMWVNDGINNSRVPRGSAIPTGWKKGIIR